MEQVKISCFTCMQMNRVPTERLSQSPKCGACGDALITGTVAELDPRSHAKATSGDEVALLVDYWAPWCGPCKMMAPEFSRAAKSLAPYIRLAKLNTQDHPAIANKLRIQGIPLLVMYRQGREVARLAGARRAPEIISFAQSQLRR